MGIESRWNSRGAYVPPMKLNSLMSVAGYSSSGCPDGAVDRWPRIGFLLPRISYLAGAFMGAADTAYWGGMLTRMDRSIWGRDRVLQLYQLLNWGSRAGLTAALTEWS